MKSGEEAVSMMNAKVLVVQDKHKEEKGDWSPFSPMIR